MAYRSAPVRRYRQVVARDCSPNEQACHSETSTMAALIVTTLATYRYAGASIGRAIFRCIHGMKQERS